MENLKFSQVLEMIQDNIKTKRKTKQGACWGDWDYEVKINKDGSRIIRMKKKE